MAFLTDLFTRIRKGQVKPFERSTDYRTKYVKKHKGFFGIYCCAYCGRLCTKSTMQVDHIFPVDGVKGISGTFGKLFVTFVCLLHGVKSLEDGVNADWNKTAACPKCNSDKRAKKGIWTIRGYIGKILFPIMNFTMAFGLLTSAISILTTGSTAAFFKVLIITAIVKGALAYMAYRR